MATWERARHIKGRYKAGLSRIAGVNGIGVTQTPTKGWFLLVMVESESVRKDIPGSLEGVEVEVRVVGKIKALAQ